MCRPPLESSVRDRTDSDTEQDQDQGGSWQGTHRPGERALEAGESSRQRPHGIPLLSRAFDWPSPEREERSWRLFAPRTSPVDEPPLTPTIGPTRGPSSVRSHTEDSDSRLLRPPHYSDAQYGRHHSAPLHGAGDWDWEQRGSFEKLPPPGTQAEGSSSRVVLPPVRDLLDELGMLSDEQYPVLPQLRLREEVRDEHREGERTRGKGKEVEEKRGVRKIYVACDFCRGRKLRCDGGRPRCFNCETRSLTCKYQEHPRRRGPGKAPKGTRTKKPRKKGGGDDPDLAGPSG